MSEAGAATGGRVVGRYALYDELAAGGMATVHIGRLIGEVGFSRSVAIKRLHPQFAHDPDFVAMFLEEARIAARIRHPNVVPVLDVVSMDDELFLVMEYVQGETLTRLTRVGRDRNRIVPMPIALAIASDMLAGLHAAHQAKDEHGKPLQIVHRDISPHNVMVGHDGAARVLDFGIAKAASSAQATQEGIVKGKFAYMSPEQLSSVPVDRRADVFAASIVIWEMLTGRRLFQGSDTAALVGQVLHGKIQPPGSVAGGLPASLDAVVLKGLERDVDARYGSALEMARAIEGLGLTIARPTEVGRWVDRIAGDALKRRAKRLEEIESTRSASVPLPPLSAPLVHETTGSSSRSGTRPVSADRSGPVDSQEIQVHYAPDPPTPRRSRTGLVLAIVAVVAVLAAGGLFVWRARSPVATAPVATPAPTPSASVVAASTPSPSASAQPTMTLDLTSPRATNPNALPRARTPNRGRTSRGSTAATATVDDTPDPAPVAAPQNDKPSRGQLQTAMGVVMPTVRACLGADDPASHANVTFQSDGSVQSVSLSGFAAGRPEQACIKNALMRAKVPAFTDATFVLPVTVQP